MIDPAKPLRVLVSEGSSTSAREAITIFGLSGHHVEVCDPSLWCLARYSRFVRKFHRCPGLRTDPAGLSRPLSSSCWPTGHFDVLLPTHEQGFLFARVRERLEGRVGLALPGFDTYRTAHSKAGFSRLLDRLGLPQPPTRIVKSADELRDAVRFPSVIKTSVGTASRGIWFVRNGDDLEIALQDLSAGDAFADEVLVQDLIAGTTEKAQSVFCRGQIDRLPCLSAGRRRCRRRRSDQAECEPARRARLSRKDRTATRLARRAVGRYHHALRQHAAASDRLQSAAGRADECVSLRCRSGWIVARCLARRDAGGVAGEPRGRADASGNAGAIGKRIARGNATRYFAGVLASVATAADLTLAVAKNSHRCGSTGSAPCR